MKRNILLVEPDKEQGELFVDWLKEEDYGVTLMMNPQEVLSSLSNEKFDLILMDIDYPEITEPSFELCRTLKKDPRLQDLPITILAYRKDAKKIRSAIEAGADNFVLKPFETVSFLERMKTIFKDTELKKEGRKVLDLNYVNYLIDLTSEASREDFFTLSSVIFNSLIMDKVKAILGEPILMVMIERARELVGEDYDFMKEIKFENSQIVTSGVDMASKKVSVEKLARAFRDYIYGFLHLVRTLTSDILMERSHMER